MKYDKHKDPEYRIKRGGGFDYGEEFTRMTDRGIRIEKFIILILGVVLLGAVLGWW